MRIFKLLVIVIALLFTATIVFAQGDDGGRVAKVYRMKVKPGDALHFETAFREHLKLGAQNGEPWAWFTWQIVNGQEFGQYVVRSHGHRWQDFDVRAQHNRLDAANFMATVAPHVHSLSSTIEVVEPAISNWPADRGRPALVAMTRFDLEYTAVQDFVTAVEKIHEAVVEKDPSRHYVWFSTVNGSDGPTMALAIPHENWADFEPNEKPLWELIAEAYGESEAQTLRETIGGAVRGESTYVLQLREDLSYEPPE
jgi:hypothetical protein